MPDDQSKARSTSTSSVGGNLRQSLKAHGLELAAMPEGTRSRNQSTKYPCGECKSECKDSCHSCFACGTWYHSGMCSGIAASILSSLTKQSGLSYAKIVKKVQKAN